MTGLSKTGADPITREQVERAMLGKTVWDVADALGTAWTDKAPQWMRTYWCRTRTGGGLVPEDIAALTRWHDELAAAEPVRRVARWDADAGLYALSPGYPLPRGNGHCMEAARVQAIAWGYEIEGGPEPVAHHAASERVAERLRAMTPAEGLAALVDAGIVTPDGELTEAYRARPEPAEDSPERLRERREALGWDLDDAADACTAAPGARWHTGNDIARLESREWPIDDAIKAARVRYAAALSAAEAERAAFDPLAGEPLYVPVPERPAPRFKVGDWVRVAQPHSQYYGHVYQVAEIRDGWHRKTVGSSQCSHWVDALEPASPPAPEVVDVPQPIVKRHRDAETSWTAGASIVMVKGPTYVDHPAGFVTVPVGVALILAMADAIRAQQGGAS